MKVITIDNPRIYLIPRIYPELTDTLVAELINEDNQESFTTEPLIWTIEKNFIKIAALDTQDLIPKANYEFTLFNDEMILYKGKIVLLDNGTDIQNFDLQDRWQ